MRRRALAAAMQTKISDKSISGLSGITKFNGKTSSMVELLAVVAKHPSKSVLLVTSQKATPLYLALGNLQGVSMKRAAIVNALDLISADHLIITKKALATITERAI